MAIKFSNLASTTLASGVSDSATSISVTSASLFPTLGSGDYFYATIGIDSGSEIVKVTGVSGTTFTIQRAQDGTSAISHSSGDEVALRVTAASLNDLSTQGDTESVSIAGDTMTGNLSLGDNVKAQFGAGNDLQIYSDGTNGVLKNTNGNYILLDSDNLAIRSQAGSNRVIVNSSGIDVTGSVVADGVQSTDGDIKVTTLGSFVGFNSQRAGVPSGGGYQLGRLNFDAYSTGTTFVSGASIQSYSDGAAWTSSSTPAYLSFQTTPSGSTSLKERIKVANNGDISFYEDTGTTPKLFWDASTERLGLGTTVPSEAITILDSTNSIAGQRIKIGYLSGNYNYTIGRNTTTGHLDFIGTNSAGSSYIGYNFNGSLHATRADLRNNSSGAETTALSLRNYAAGANTATALNFYPTQSTARFASIVAENLDGNNNIALSFLTSAGDTPTAALTLDQNRNATFSGDLSLTSGKILFGTSYNGTIGTASGDLFIGTADSNILFYNGSSVLPANSVGGIRDNAIDLGSTSARFKNAHLSVALYSPTIFGSSGATGVATLQSCSGNANHAKITVGDVVSSDNGGITFYTAGSSTATQALRLAGTSQAATFSGSVTTQSGISSIYDRLKIINGSSQLNIGQWDGTNHRVEGDASRPIFITSYNSGGVSIGVSSSTKLKVTSSATNIMNNLMVGSTTAPDTALHVETSADTIVKVEKTGGNYIQLHGTGAGGRIKSDGQINFDVGSNSGALNLASNGNATFSGSVDVTGSVTADGLTVSNGTYHKVVSTFPATYTTNLQIGQQGNINNNALTDTLLINHNAQATQSNVLFNINDKSVLKLQEGGDISFYEDTGTTPKLFWDASLERLGLRTSTPIDTLDIRSGGLRLYDNTDGNGGVISFGSSSGYQTIGGGSGSNDMHFRTYANHIFKTTTGASSTTDGTERLKINSSGIDVTGSVTADGLTVDSTTGFSWLPVSTAGAKLGAIGTGSSVIFNTPSVNANYGSGLAIDGSYASDLSSVNIKAFGAKYNSYGSELNLFTSSGTSLLKRLAIASNGDISFYNDSAAQAFHFDSSTSRLGLGVTNPANKLEISGGNIRIINQSTGRITFNNGSTEAYFGFNGAGSSTLDSGSQPLQIQAQGSNHIQFDTNSVERFKINADGSSVFSGSVTADNSSGAMVMVDDTNGRFIKIRSGNSGSQNANISSYAGLYLGGSDNASHMLISNTGNVGIGTNSPNSYSNYTALTINGTNGGLLDFETNGTFVGEVFADSTNGLGLQSIGSRYIRFLTNGGERLRIDSSGKALFKGAAQTGYALFDDGTNGGIHIKADTSSVTTEYITTGFGAFEEARFVASNFVFKNSGSSTRAVIDTSGNFLVGQTTNAETGTGIGLVPDGTSHMYSANTDALMLGRGGSDGEILSFNRSGTTVGSVGVDNGDNLTISGNSSHAGLNFSDAAVNPYKNGNYANGTVDLGEASSARWKDLHLSGHINMLGNDNQINGGTALYLDSDNTVFRLNNETEIMRFSGTNLLVGKTASGLANSGFEVGQSGQINVTQAGAVVARFNRKTSSGSILELASDGTTVGSIGSNSGLFIGSTYGTDSGIRFASSIIGPSTTTGANRDAAIDLGYSSSRFKDLYLSGGVYQNGTRLTKRTSPSSGGSGIFASITNAPQTGFVHIYETGTDKYLILACFKKDTSSNPVTNVVANNGLTVNATNAGGTIAIAGATTSGNVKMQATIIREA